MNIQSYILPEWNKKIENSNLSDEIQTKFKKIGSSMAEYFDSFMTGKVSSSFFDGWVRFHFHLNVDSRKIQISKIIADIFVDFVESYRKKKTSKFSFDSEKIDQISNLNQEIKNDKKAEEEHWNKIKQEVAKIRKERSKSRKKPPRKKKSRAKRNEKSKPVKIEPKSTYPNPDKVYEKWMEHVNEKRDKDEISKSYWYIHEYIGRYILEYVRENRDEALITEDVVEEFLEDYGKDKRPKTMNHYNRVARYFYEFYEGLLN